MAHGVKHEGTKQHGADHHNEAGWFWGRLLNWGYLAAVIFQRQACGLPAGVSSGIVAGAPQVGQPLDFLVLRQTE